MLEAMGRLFERSDTAKGVALAVLLAINMQAARLYQSHLEKTFPAPNPPKVVDINGDGIEDKILQEKAYIPWTGGARIPQWKDKILYGIGEINGRLVYLTKELFEDYKKNQ